ncbi:hypothetical protein C8J55DRAFT_557639 [Lentinula edodes]|uniref:Uncharacterized protein n=1 Tax=Lentinula lateritia TaxID=40482 RepID=A0A9W9ASZ2_9AGAR|nr:hypothetical protein C8J55DRAFT_557639 [Lentinula edodes]
MPMPPLPSSYPCASLLPSSVSPSSQSPLSHPIASLSPSPSPSPQCSPPGSSSESSLHTTPHMRSADSLTLSASDHGTITATFPDPFAVPKTGGLGLHGVRPSSIPRFIRHAYSVPSHSSHSSPFSLTPTTATSSLTFTLINPIMIPSPILLGACPYEASDYYIQLNLCVKCSCDLILQQLDSRSGVKGK